MNQEIKKEVNNPVRPVGDFERFSMYSSPREEVMARTLIDLIQEGLVSDEDVSRFITKNTIYVNSVISPGSKPTDYMFEILGGAAAYSVNSLMDRVKSAKGEDNG